jgi:hypothetical protein
VNVLTGERLSFVKLLSILCSKLAQTKRLSVMLMSVQHADSKFSSSYVVDGRYPC